MTRCLNLAIVRSIVQLATCCGTLIGLAATAQEVGPPVAADVRPADVRVAAVTYVDRADGPLAADVFLPEGEGPFPGVLLVHGGAWMLGNKSRMNAIGQHLARSGMVAVSINYRLAPKHKFPAQLEDCQSAVGWMRTNAEKYQLDPTRLGAYGYSAGGHLVTLLAATAAKSDSTTPAVQATGDYRLQAVVAGGAPCDFREIPADSTYLAYWLGGTRRQKEDLYRLASPREFVTPRAPPVFFFHAERDTLVPLANVADMRAALTDAGVEADLYIVPQTGHVGAFFDEQARNRASDFLSRHLGAKAGANEIGSAPRAERK